MMRWLAALLALCVTALSHAAHTNLPETELLESDRAFALSPRVLDAQTLEARWTIASGYYMYRDKFTFEATSNAIVLGTPVFPAGKRRHDPFFGTVETYTEEVAVRLPIARYTQEQHTASVRITAQGCNEPVGVCYPPITREVSYDLPATIATGTPTATTAITSLQPLRDLVGGSDSTQEFLHPDKAFVLHIEPTGAAALQARFDIADGYYLYRDKTRFELEEATGMPTGAVKLGAYALPAGKPKVDEYFGETVVYYHHLEVELALHGTAMRATELQLYAHYQGCADQGICYPPIKKRFDLRLDANGVPAVTPVTNTGEAAPAASLLAPAEPGPASTALPGFLLAVFGAFAAGLLLYRVLTRRR